MYVYLQSTAGLVTGLVAFDSVNFAGHHVLETVCSGASFLFRRVPFPSVRITVLPQGRREYQSKFIACNEIKIIVRTVRKEKKKELPL